MGLRRADALRVIEHLGAIDTSLCTLVAVHNLIASHLIREYGSDLLQQALVPDLTSGRQLAAFALTEAGAGSDPRRIETMAVYDPDR